MSAPRHRVKRVKVSLLVRSVRPNAVECEACYNIVLRQKGRSKKSWFLDSLPYGIQCELTYKHICMRFLVKLKQCCKAVDGDDQEIVQFSMNKIIYSCEIYPKAFGKSHVIYWGVPNRGVQIRASSLSANLFMQEPLQFADVRFRVSLCSDQNRATSLVVMRPILTPSASTFSASALRP